MLFNTIKMDTFLGDFKVFSSVDHIFKQKL